MPAICVFRSLFSIPSNGAVSTASSNLIAKKKKKNMDNVRANSHEMCIHSVVSWKLAANALLLLVRALAIIIFTFQKHNYATNFTFICVWGCMWIMVLPMDTEAQATLTAFSLEYDVDDDERKETKQKKLNIDLM